MNPLLDVVRSPGDGVSPSSPSTSSFQGCALHGAVGGVAIPLSNGGVAIVDEQDSHLSRWAWYRNLHGYAVRTNRKRGALYMHREILGLTRGDGKQCDHIDQNPLNNRRSNLRVGTQAQNRQNTTPRAGSSRYRGVWWCSREEKWMAMARLDNKNHSLGAFAEEIDAARSAEAFRRTHMSFAVPNQTLDPLPDCRCTKCRGAP